MRHVILLSSVFFASAFVLERFFGFSSYSFLAVASPPTIIGSVLPSQFFYLVLFLYYLLVVSIGYVCFTRWKMAFVIFLGCLFILHLLSYFYALDGIKEFARYFVEQ